MKPDDLDRWMSDDDTIVPSSGFSASVMEAIRHEASDRHAMPFPWKRALPGLVMTVLAMVAVLWSGFQAFNASEAGASPRDLLPSLVAVTAGGEAVWVILATLMTIVLVMTCIRWTRARL